jgi:hypothetical protein
MRFVRENLADPIDEGVLTNHRGRLEQADNLVADRGRYDRTPARQVVEETHWRAKMIKPAVSVRYDRKIDRPRPEMQITMRDVTGDDTFLICNERFDRWSFRRDRKLPYTQERSDLRFPRQFGKELKVYAVAQCSDDSDNRSRQALQDSVTLLVRGRSETGLSGIH